MSSQLTKEEKVTIIDQHLKSINYSLYGFELELKEAQAVAAPDTDSVNALNSRISDLNAKITVLNNELASLE